MDRKIIDFASARMRKGRSGASVPVQHHDPIDGLLKSGVPARILVAHQLPCVEWLALHRRDKFCICYFDAAGQVVTERLDASQLLIRAQEIGWSPLHDQVSPDAGRHLFEEASYNRRGGVHWYASAHDQTDDMLPLGFPEDVLRRAHERQERRRAAAEKRAHQRALRNERLAANERRKRAAKLLDSVAMRILMAPGKDGSAPTTKSQARRQVRGMVESLMADFRQMRGNIQLPHG